MFLNMLYKEVQTDNFTQLIQLDLNVMLCCIMGLEATVSLVLMVTVSTCLIVDDFK